MTRKCKVCSSVFRDEIDSYIGKNKYTFKEIASIFQDKGFIISESTLRRHTALHTNYKVLTSVFKEIETDDLDNNDGLDMSIDLDSYLAQFDLTQSDFKCNSVEDLFKISKNFYSMNTLLVMKLYAIVNLQTDLNIKGIGNFPTDKIKCLNLLLSLNNNLHTQFKDYDTTKTERLGTAKFLKIILNEIELAVKTGNTAKLQNEINLSRDLMDELIADNMMLYEDYTRGINNDTRMQKNIRDISELLEDTEKDLNNIEQKDEKN